MINIHIMFDLKLISKEISPKFRPGLGEVFASANARQDPIEGLTSRYDNNISRYIMRY